jgi:hypothetical protein
MGDIQGDHLTINAGFNVRRRDIREIELPANHIKSHNFDRQVVDFYCTRRETPRCDSLIQLDTDIITQTFCCSILIAAVRITIIFYKRLLQIPLVPARRTRAARRSPVADSAGTVDWVLAICVHAVLACTGIGVGISTSRIYTYIGCTSEPLIASAPRGTSAGFRTNRTGAIRGILADVCYTFKAFITSASEGTGARYTAYGTILLITAGIVIGITCITTAD